MIQPSLRMAILAGLLGLAACGVEAPSGGDEVAVQVGDVGLDSRRSPVLVLRETSGPRVLRIWIGHTEAWSIATRMQDRRPARPNSHDLAERLIAGLSGEVTRVVVSDLRAGVYFATLTLRQNGELVEIDSRPSDAIAIAVRTGAPIFVRDRLLEDEDDGSSARGSGRSI